MKTAPLVFPYRRDSQDQKIERAASRLDNLKLTQKVHEAVVLLLTTGPDDRRLSAAKNRAARWLAPHLPQGSHVEKNGLKHLVREGWAKDQLGFGFDPWQATKEKVALEGVNHAVAFYWAEASDIRKFGSEGVPDTFVVPALWLAHLDIESPERSSSVVLLDWWFITRALRASRELLRTMGQTNRDVGYKQREREDVMVSLESLAPIAVQDTPAPDEAVELRELRERVARTTNWAIAEIAKRSLLKAEALQRWVDRKMGISEEALTGSERVRAERARETPEWRRVVRELEPWLREYV